MICKDCGVDTTPCTGKRGCRHAGRWENYMVRDRLWKASGMKGGFLCVGCLEARLGRRLTPRDFTKAIINNLSPWDSPRLAARKILSPTKLTRLTAWCKRHGENPAAVIAGIIELRLR